MDLCKELYEQIKKRIAYLGICDTFLVEPCKDKNHGDFATNIALVFCKKLNDKPMNIALKIKEIIGDIDHIFEISIANPGFINIKMNECFWQNELRQILRQKDSYRINKNLGRNQKTNVEFVSANPTGPMHAGHARNAVFGDIIASLMKKVGFDVKREYYINDSGVQIDSLAKSVLLRYDEISNGPNNTTENEFTDDMYKGEYVISLAKTLYKKHGESLLKMEQNDTLEILKQESLTFMINDIKKDLNDLGVVMDIYTSEKELIKSGAIEDAIKTLMQSGDVYMGTLPPPKGQIDEDWTEKEQLLFRSTKYGDTVDRVIQKSDGSWTYFAGDIAYHNNKLKRGFKVLLDVLGADHSGYVKRLQSCVKALSDALYDDSEGALQELPEALPNTEFDVKICQLVNFMENGQAIRMSKRSGNFVTLKDVVDRVGKDSTRYMMVSKSHDTTIDFDFEKVIEQSYENPVFYIQYAHVRICSVIRHANSVFNDLVNDSNITYNDIDLNLLIMDEELEMIKAISDWPRQIHIAALKHEPHRVANFLSKIAAMFHSMWGKGRSNAALRFIDEKNKEKTLQKLALLRAIKCILSGGLEILGMKPMEEM